MKGEFDEVAALMPDPFRILHREITGSTNDDLRELAIAGMAEGLVLIAEKQTAGRGRRGAVWFSPVGENLAFSVLLRPSAPKALWGRLSLIAGLAVAEAAEKSLPIAGIKWPNDVQVDGKKIAGILVEAGSDFVVVGVGVNVNSRNFPEGLDATSLGVEAGYEISRSAFLLDFVNRFSHHSGRLENSFDDVLRGVSQRCVLTGKRVSLFLTGGTRREGRVRGLGPRGELLLEAETGVQALFQADEIRLLD